MTELAIRANVMISTRSEEISEREGALKTDSLLNVNAMVFATKILITLLLFVFVNLQYISRLYSFASIVEYPSSHATKTVFSCVDSQG